MTAPHRVSVIIGTHNRPATLRAALASIRALEGPDLTFEILVGDNGATPETQAVVAEFGGVYATTDVRGCPAARNLALRGMTGDFVAFLDDDDLWTRDNIRPHIALMQADAEIAAVFGQIVHADHEMRPVGPPWPLSAEMDGDIFVRMLSGYFPQVGATVVRGAVARECGLMDEALIGDSDWDWQLRLTKTYKTAFTATPSVLCRGRPPGSYDEIQLLRLPYTRRIFWRHARSALNRWPTPVHLLRSYFGAVETYYNYFVNAASDRVERGDFVLARRAVRQAFALNPTRALRSMTRPSRLRGAARRAFFNRGSLAGLPPPPEKAPAPR
jgi:glycosyltransferase involved in cell wall biosynthesis